MNVVILFIWLKMGTIEDIYLPLLSFSGGMAFNIFFTVF